VLLDEEEMKVLDEIEVPCCALEDKEAVHEDEETTYVGNTRAPQEYLYKKKQ
jgi:hypothetical protein